MKTQEQAIEKALSKVVSGNTAKEVASLTGGELKEVYNVVYEQMAYNHQLEEITVKDVVQSLYELTKIDFTKEDILEVQELFYNNVDQLASLLGIELED